MISSLQFDLATERRTPRLLVSVAAAADVAESIAGGANIIDVKDPKAGALGRPSPQCLREVVASVDDRVPVTAAWGELAEARPLNDEQRAGLRGVRLVKLGTAHFPQQQFAWRQFWEPVRESLPADIAIAIVHYADWRRAEALDLAASLSLADEVGAAALVVDTHTKLRDCLLDFYSPPQLRDVVERARSRRLAVVFAGSLRTSHIPSVLDCAPSVIGVRGAACRRGDREGPVCREQVAALKRAMSLSGRQRNCTPSDGP